ncbi:MAG TPA: hypothetical protein VE242_13280 [Chthoniobacterales bacterium]|nr:hypothetical protein [Chthoniobacterales bacterium]
MDAKTTLHVLTISVVISLGTSQAAMPFGRLMPLHYAPDDVRTLVVPRAEISSPSVLQQDSLPKVNFSVALAARS